MDWVVIFTDSCPEGGIIVLDTKRHWVQPGWGNCLVLRSWYSRSVGTILCELQNSEDLSKDCSRLARFVAGNIKAYHEIDLEAPFDRSYGLGTCCSKERSIERLQCLHRT